MMKYYVADAFTDRIFSGGQAAVTVLKDWPNDQIMQDIAAEFNISETSFLIKRDGYYDLRWFMPGGEMNLVGHATLAAAYVLFNYFEKDANKLSFHTMSGELIVARDGDMIEMDFPAIQVAPYPLSPEMVAALGGAVPKETYKSRDLTFVFEDEAAVRAVRPDFEKMRALQDGLGVFISAKGTDSDIVARAFWPKMGIPEDPVCGSMHCNLTPLWAKKLGKKKLVSHQLSPRGGVLYLEDRGERVRLAGHAALSAVGEMNVLND